MNRILPEQRRPLLLQRLEAGDNLRIIEVHNGLSALIANNVAEEDGRGFDGVWISSLTCSAARGLPDMEMYIVERRLELVDEIVSVSNKPVIVDADTGGDPTTFEFFCAKLESLGVSAVVVEDKRHPKRNSFCGTNADLLEDIPAFVAKIRRGKEALVSNETMLFARIESLVAGAGIEDALTRARAYIRAGADGIMIHSKSKTPNEIFLFCRGYETICAEEGRRPPLMCVPTTYNKVRAIELFDHGMRIVIYANHLLRASHLAMTRACASILENDRSADVDSACCSVDELFAVTGYHAAIEREQTGTNSQHLNITFSLFFACALGRIRKKPQGTPSCEFLFCPAMGSVQKLQKRPYSSLGP